MSDTNPINPEKMFEDNRLQTRCITLRRIDPDTTNYIDQLYQKINGCESLRISEIKCRQDRRNSSCTSTDSENPSTSNATKFAAIVQLPSDNKRKEKNDIDSGEDTLSAAAHGNVEPWNPPASKVVRFDDQTKFSSITIKQSCLPSSDAGSVDDTTESPPIGEEINANKNTSKDDTVSSKTVSNIEVLESQPSQVGNSDDAAELPTGDGQNDGISDNNFSGDPEETNSDIQRGRDSPVDQHVTDSPLDSDGSEYIPSEKEDEDTDSNQSDEDQTVDDGNGPQVINNDRRSADFTLDDSFNKPGNSACDNRNQFADLSKGAKGGQKKNFCFYCHTEQSKIVRHLILKHADEESVRKFAILPVRSHERQKLIAEIRKKGNFLFNVNDEWNNGKIIPVRRPRQETRREATNFETCPTCRGFYSKNNLRHHVKKCGNTAVADSRSILQLARRTVGRIHACASTVLRQRVFPVMRDDEISRILRYDELAILYGNKLCKHLRLPHQHDEIRAILRRVGRFLKVAIEIDPTITDLASIFDPKYYNTAIEAVNVLAGLDPDTQLYKTPSNASAMGTTFKKVGLILEAECIKKNDDAKKKKTKDFLKLLAEDFGCSVNKNVAESQTAVRQGKSVNLPKIDDIKKLNDYLDGIIEKELASLTESFSVESWTNLSQAVLIKIQVFNRKRAGELERLTIEQFNNRTRIQESDDLYQGLSVRDRQAAKTYCRIVIRGKKNRSVAFLMSATVLDAVDMIIKHRKRAKVPSRNPFVFGVHSNDPTRFKYQRACPLMRAFSARCNATNSLSLRGTNLRKQLATRCATLDLTDQQISHVANFMGHDEHIHRGVYRQQIDAVDILDMSKVLEKAQGIDAQNNSRVDTPSLSDEEVSDPNTTNFSGGETTDCGSQDITIEGPSITDSDLQDSLTTPSTSKKNSLKTRRATPSTLSASQHSTRSKTTSAVRASKKRKRLVSPESPPAELRRATRRSGLRSSEEWTESVMPSTRRTQSKKRKRSVSPESPPAELRRATRRSGLRSSEEWTESVMPSTRRTQSKKRKRSVSPESPPAELRRATRRSGLRSSEEWTESEMQSTRRTKKPCNTNAKTARKPVVAGRKLEIQRRRWTEEEKNQAFSCFGSHVRAGTLPTFKEICGAQQKLKVLTDREPSVIKTWIHNQIRKNKTSSNMRF